MHFSIPDTEEFSDNGGSMYMGYNIHINGTFHCSVRYRQLLSLHEQIRRELGPSAASNLPPFPPKRLLPLSPSQLEERRAVLEKYIQTVSQDGRVASSELFMGFLLSAQVETSKEPSSPVTLDVYLMNEKRITVDINATAPSHQVLMSVCQKLHLPPELLGYFSLFLVRREADGDITVIKKLQNFESPYISLKYMESPHRVVLRKGFWDTGLESALLEDSVALNLLYTQAVADLELGWMLADLETRELLTNLQVQGEKSEYLDVVRGLKYYGFMQFKPCWCDYPRPGTRVCISAGNRELNFRVQLSTPDGSSCSGSSDSVCGGDVTREGSFRVTRMRCWRITTLHNGEQSASLGGLGNGPGPRLELSFEYLMSKERLQWVTVCSDQAILMSTCLQDMVSELLIKKNGGIPVKAASRMKNSTWSYMRRDGSSQRIATMNKSISSDGLSETSQSSRSQDSSDSTAPRNETHHSTSSATSSGIRRLSEKLSSVALGIKSTPANPTNPFVENDAFEGIGDDDL